MIDDKIFEECTDLVIERLEGGYYHPIMLQDGRVKSSLYKSSGETFMGMDRKTGGSINTTAACKEFWSIIDNANAKTNWSWGYMGGSLRPRLKALAIKMIRPQFDYLFNRYLSQEAREIVAKDKRLLFHFIYATWNGAGWFEKFASDMNQAVASGTKNPDKLVQVALNSRLNEGLHKGSSPNALIRQGGQKIEKIFQNDIKQDTPIPYTTNMMQLYVGSGLIVVGVIGLGYAVYKLFIENKLNK